MYFSNGNSIATYEEVKDAPNKPGVLLIDVRTEKEVKETGLIPSSIHIPMYLLLDTFSPTVNKERFLEKFGRKYPEADDEIIFYCLAGVRALKAMEIACSYGFKKSRYYKGSWMEWASLEAMNSNQIENELTRR